MSRCWVCVAQPTVNHKCIQLFQKRFGSLTHISIMDSTLTSTPSRAQTSSSEYQRMGTLRILWGALRPLDTLIPDYWKWFKQYFGPPMEDLWSSFIRSCWVRIINCWLTKFILEWKRIIPSNKMHFIYSNYDVCWWLINTTRRRE